MKGPKREVQTLLLYSRQAQCEVVVNVGLLIWVNCRKGLSPLTSHQRCVGGECFHTKVFSQLTHLTLLMKYTGSSRGALNSSMLRIRHYVRSGFLSGSCVNI